MYGPETSVTERTGDMGDNLVPNGLSEGCKVSFSRLADGAREEHPWPGHCGSARAFAVNPRAPKARALCGLRGIDRSARPSKWACHAKNVEKRPLRAARFRPPYLRHG